jgi:hypothetical protein
VEEALGGARGAEKVASDAQRCWGCASAEEERRTGRRSKCVVAAARPRSSRAAQGREEREGQ